MNQRGFMDWLAEREIIITPATCSLMVAGKITPGPKFKGVFRKLTGIQLVDGLLEEEE